MFMMVYVNTVVVKAAYFCDICNEPRKTQCDDCRRDVCSKHVIYVTPDTGDYSDNYCIDCNSIREKYSLRFSKFTIAENKLYDKLENELKQFKNTIKSNSNKQ